LTGSQTHLLTPLSREPENYLPALADVQAGLTDTDLGSALPVIRGMLGRRARWVSAAEVWFITDNHSTPGVRVLRNIPRWPADSREGSRRRCRRVGSAERLDHSRSSAGVQQTARRVLRVELGCVGDEAQERKLHLDATPRCRPAPRT